MHTSPIGIFDSGFGGLSVWKEIRQLLPNESLIYYADSANCPYGSQSPEAIIQHSRRIIDFLLAQHCKLIVVACNTATAAAIEYLRANYSVPLIGMEPATKPAALQSKSKVIGILATKGTLEGRLFKSTKAKYTEGVKVLIQIGKGLVELVENNQMHTPEAEALLKKYLQPMLDEKIDQLVLGCTHYPFLTPMIQQVVGEQVNIINPAPAVARQTKAILEKHHLHLQTQLPHPPPYFHFYNSGDITRLQRFVEEQVGTYLGKGEGQFYT